MAGSVTTVRPRAAVFGFLVAAVLLALADLVHPSGLGRTTLGTVIGIGSLVAIEDHQKRCARGGGPTEHGRSDDRAGALGP